MQIVIYRSKDGVFTRYCLAGLIRETATHVEFSSQEYIQEELGVSYFLKSKSQEGLPELKRIEIPTSYALEPPYIYIAEYKEVCKWVEPESSSEERK